MVLGSRGIACGLLSSDTRDAPREAFLLRFASSDTREALSIFTCRVSHYYSEILGPKYVSFSCYEYKNVYFPQKCDYHAQSSYTLLWDSVMHISMISMETKPLEHFLFYF